MNRILVVEDEGAIARGLKFNFEQEGYEVDLAADGRTALDLHGSASPEYDLIVLDLMLPEMSGYETCRELRLVDADVPVLALTARTLAEDKAQAFDCGVDQYITKPFALPELLSRVRNLLERRQRSQNNQDVVRAVSDLERFGDVEVDFGRFELSRDGDVHSLTTREQQLLKYFLQHEDVVLSRTRLQTDVWRDAAEITSRSIDNFVMRLRKMIEPDPSNPQHLISIRGTGYRFIRNPIA
ncbi:MAG: response regulator transcription factor [Fuerstiella sp.]